MLDHIGFKVSDFERSKAFYAQALAPLAIALIMEVTAEQSGDADHAGFGADGKPFFWIGSGEPAGRRSGPYRPDGRLVPGQRRAGASAAFPSRLLRGLRA
jgi:catechol 2,3-dioxygenase-like lactoylglutathione lyase family enzyme